MQYMSFIDKWGIDVFCISDLTNHRPLTAVTYTILQVIFDDDRRRQTHCEQNNTGPFTLCVGGPVIKRTLFVYHLVRFNKRESK